ncbi:MAG: LuxR C-terminal-related transcriptional regulator, partial [Gemmatimonadaceae bacterium]
MGVRGRPKHPDILTPREWEVLALLREHRTNAEIADALAISFVTARFHVSE